MNLQVTIVAKPELPELLREGVGRECVELNIHVPTSDWTQEVMAKLEEPVRFLLRNWQKKVSQ